MFWHGIYRAIISRLSNGAGKNYFLRFDADGTLNVFKRAKKCAQYKGASHADDLFYLFNSKFAENVEKSSKEFKVVQQMVGIYTNFAINGTPNCEEIEPVKFTVLSADREFKCVQITENEVKEIVIPEIDKLKVWDSIYKDHDVPMW